MGIFQRENGIHSTKSIYWTIHPYTNFYKNHLHFSYHFHCTHYESFGRNSLDEQRVYRKKRTIPYNNHTWYFTLHARRRYQAKSYQCSEKCSQRISHEHKRSGDELDHFFWKTIFTRLTFYGYFWDYTASQYDYPIQYSSRKTRTLRNQYRRCSSFGNFLRKSKLRKSEHRTTECSTHNGWNPKHRKWSSWSHTKSKRTGDSDFHRRYRKNGFRTTLLYQWKPRKSISPGKWQKSHRKLRWNTPAEYLTAHRGAIFFSR